MKLKLDENNEVWSNKFHVLILIQKGVGPLLHGIYLFFIMHSIILYGLDILI